MPGLTQLTRICLGASSSAVHLKSRGKHPVGSGSGRIWIRLDQDPAGSGSGWIRSNQDPVENPHGSVTLLSLCKNKRDLQIIKLININRCYTLINPLMINLLTE